MAQVYWDLLWGQVWTGIFFIQLWNCHRRLWIVRQVDGIRVHRGCWTQRCRYGLFWVLWKSMSYRLQGVGEIYWRKNRSVSDSFSVVSPWVYVPDNCWRREWMGLFFFFWPHMTLCTTPWSPSEISFIWLCELGSAAELLILFMVRICNLELK